MRERFNGGVGSGAAASRDGGLGRDLFQKDIV
jgi:hypothetical protein